MTTQLQLINIVIIIIIKQYIAPCQALVHIATIFIFHKTVQHIDHLSEYSPPLVDYVL